MTSVKLKQGREKSLFYRHPWVFSGAIQNVDELKNAENGSIVDVADFNGNFLARGYYNSASNIAVRVLSFKNEEIDENFFVSRVRAAWEMRRAYFDAAQTDALRVVFAEGDGLPGLIVDKYGDVLVLQIHTLGMEKLKDLAVKALKKVFDPECIYERSDVSVRRLEGLRTLPTGILFGELEDDGLLKVRENGLEFMVDIVNGQKTGFFLDQRENRATIQKYAAGRKVLNLFSYSGGFSCYALKGGAAHVTSVDISEAANDLCRKNVELNGFDAAQHEAVTADAFEYLEKGAGGAGEAAGAQKFDLVIVDPPAFVKSQKNLDAALRAYAKLNEQALRVLKPAGILVTSSCSAHVTVDMFKKALFQAALRTGDDLKILEQRTQPFDHPSRLYFPEGDYLKFFVLQR
jgi:23S rRNA (cytosine1962-C5)-methyltransferase